MKNFKFFTRLRVGLYIFIAILFSNFSNKCLAQQQNAQWSFYMAFEDATGAKDSIWFLLDTASTVPDSISGLYGEHPIEEDSINFQVWFYHPLDYVNGNPTERYNTFLGRITNDEAAFSPDIHSENFVLPITATWDSSLFTSEVLYEYGGNPINKAILDNDYLFLSGGDEYGWDMTQTDHVELPHFWWGSGSQFPLFFNIERGPLNSGVGIDDLEKIEFSVFPNPATDYVFLTFPKVVTGKLRILDLNGKLVQSSIFSGVRKRINIGELESGLYFIEIEDKDGSVVKKLMVN